MLILYDEIESMIKDAVVAYLKKVFQHMPGETVKNYYCTFLFLS
jgi:hypothetical protein